MIRLLVAAALAIIAGSSTLAVDIALAQDDGSITLPDITVTGTRLVPGPGRTPPRRSNAPTGDTNTPAGPASGRDRRIPRDEPRSRRAGLPVRGADDLLRFHAGNRDGERSHARLLPVARSQPAHEKSAVNGRPCEWWRSAV